MKEIRKIKEVISMQYEDENNNKSKQNDLSSINYPDDLTDESGFFHLTVRPLLAPGHETELVYFVQSMGLITQIKHCEVCDKSMKWIPSRNLDLFQWRCFNCDKKCSIRQKSPFNDIKCSFKNILLVILSWCNNDDVEHVLEAMDLKKSVVNQIYYLASQTAEKYIRKNISQWQIGGPGVVVLVDTFPEGCTSDIRRSNRPILCLAELKGVPPTMWFEALKSDSKNRDEIIKLNKEKCLEIVQTIVHPESIVVARQNSTLCSYHDLKHIEHKFKILVSNEGLSRHDSEERRLIDNLNVIWKEALDVCMTAQYCHHSLVQSFLMSYMWRRKFNHEAYQHLLHEISHLVG